MVCVHSSDVFSLHFYYNGEISLLKVDFRTAILSAKTIETKQGENYLLVLLLPNAGDILTRIAIGNCTNFAIVIFIICNFY